MLAKFYKCEKEKEICSLKSGANRFRVEEDFSPEYEQGMYIYFVLMHRVNTSCNTTIIVTVMQIMAGDR